MLGPSTSRDAALSADGRYVAFSSVAANLVDNDTNGFSDVFVRDQVTHRQPSSTSTITERRRTVAPRGQS